MTLPKKAERRVLECFTEASESFKEVMGIIKKDGDADGEYKNIAALAFHLKKVCLAAAAGEYSVDVEEEVKPKKAAPKKAAPPAKGKKKAEPEEDFDEDDDEDDEDEDEEDEEDDDDEDDEDEEEEDEPVKPVKKRGRPAKK
jgi:hypothetical protein